MSNSSYDVIVSGAGPSGVAAALAAARRGARTLLIERYGFCGGMATAGLVNPWAGHAFHDPLDPASGRPGSLIGGIFKEVVTALAAGQGFGSGLSDAAFDEELLKYVYDSLLAEAGVNLLYHSYVSRVKKADGRIAAVETLSKGGNREWHARTFIDCSGDADLAAQAGCSFVVGRAGDGLMQAMTVNFRMAGVDKTELLQAGTLRQARALVEPYFQEALQSGSLHYPYRNFVHFYDYPRPGILHFNMTRINRVSGLSATDLTHAETEGRRQAFLIADWLARNVPCFRHAYVEKVACQVGVRETRHIHGFHTMTMEDIVEARKFPDGIARSRYFIDIHNPTGATDPHQKAGAKGAVKPEFGPPAGDFYEVPFRSLITPECPNLIVACRALSATHEAAAAVRVMATMHAIGEAAGLAAAAAKEQDCDIMNIPGEHVRAEIPYLHEPPDFGPPWNACPAMEAAA